VLVDASAVMIDSSAPGAFLGVSLDGALTTNPTGTSYMTYPGGYQSIKAGYSSQVLSEGNHYFSLLGGISGGAAPYYASGHTGMNIITSR
jgi:hypothetical protein